MRVCSVHGCPELFPTSEGSKCRKHRRQADQARGTATQRGYNTTGHRHFREAVLAHDPVCVICHAALATVADHYPRSRKQQIALGLDPDDPNNGRGLCITCHNRETAHNQPGGWNSP